MRIMLVFGGGGHTSQMLRLWTRLNKQYEYVFVAAYGDALTCQKLPKEKFHHIHKPNDYGDDEIKLVLKAARSLIDSFRLMAKEKPDVIISAGPGLSIPLMYTAKLFGAKVIFVESWSRVYHRSLSGRFVYPIADLFFIQWSELKRIYPQAVYVGRLA